MTSRRRRHRPLLTRRHLTSTRPAIHRIQSRRINQPRTNRRTDRIESIPREIRSALASGDIHNGEGFGGPEDSGTVEVADFCVVVPGVEVEAGACAFGEDGCDGSREVYAAAAPGAGEGGGIPDEAGFADAVGCC